MQGHGGDEVAWRENLEVPLHLRVELGAVDDQAIGVGLVRGADLHLLHGEGVADDVLGQALQILALVGQHAPAAMDVEPGMDPASQHVRSLHRLQALVHQEGDDPRAEQLFQRLQAHLGSRRRGIEQARAHEQAVGDQGVQVGVKVQVLAEGVDGHDDAGQTLGQAKRGMQVFEQALVGKDAQVLEQVPVEAEVRAQHLGDAEGEMAVGHGKEDRFGEEHAEELDLLLVAGRPEPAPPCTRTPRGTRACSDRSGRGRTRVRGHRSRGTC